ncbi:secreted phosphoprotein 24-like [Hypanus sabinus]|uniref:secreted phosphoprotein 24-like n=1 Tax=Hypanus sabinus TaxID=79690 RepID=UPI0028C493BB|nr:secreted phosphoprotein 24-like [Hypanus sabinus]
MKSFLLAIAAVQILHCSGVPHTKEALRASVIKLNEITEIPNLCGISRTGVIDVYRTGKLTYNVDLTFYVTETICSKNSGWEFDDSVCFFHPKQYAERGFCRSHVEYFADKVVYVDVECDGLKTVDSESYSLESSEISFEDESKSKETSLDEASNAYSKSEETSLQESSNVKSKETESSSNESTVDSRAWY